VTAGSIAAIAASDVRISGTGRVRSGRWAAFAAAVWAFLFALPSFYWAAGGGFALHTIARDPDEVPLAKEPALVFGTGLLKVVAGLLALALVMPWKLALPRRLLVVAAWAVGGVLLLYGAANMIQHALMEAGAADVPETLGPTSLRWHLFLWDPWFILGGILFLLAARESPGGTLRFRS